MSILSGKHWTLCPNCKSSLSVHATEGLDKITITIYAAPKEQTALPLNTNRQEVKTQLRAAIGPIVKERRMASMRGGIRKRMIQIFDDTMRQYKAHKWDRYVTAQAMEIETDALKERMRVWEKRGWIKRNGKGWVRVKETHAHNMP